MINPEQATSSGHIECEASLDELLSDDAVIALMRADRVTVENVRSVVSNAGRGLETRRYHVIPSDMRADGAFGREDRAGMSALALLDDGTSVGRDLRRDQLVRLQALGATQVAEVGRMLSRVGLETNALPGSVRADFYLTCADCTKRPLCRLWLAAGEADDGYRAFCPNVPLFDRMRQVQQWRRGPAHSTSPPR